MGKCFVALRAQLMARILLWRVARSRVRSPTQTRLPLADAFAFLRASAHGAERVNSSYRQNQRDEGVGSVCNFLEIFVKYAIWMDLRCLIIQLKGKSSSEVTFEVILRSQLPPRQAKYLLMAKCAWTSE